MDDKTKKLPWDELRRRVKIHLKRSELAEAKRARNEDRTKH